MTMQTALVPFYHDTVESAYDDEAKIAYFVPKHICLNIGLDWSSQNRVLLNDEILSGETLYGDITIEGLGRREVLLLPLKYLPGWLFQIQPKRVREDVRPKLILYKRECYDVLDTYWRNGGVAVNPRSALLDSDLQLIVGMATAIQETRHEARSAHALALQAKAGLEEHSYLFGDVQESANETEGRVTQLELWYRELSSRVCDLQEANAASDRHEWLHIYDYASTFHPDLQEIWKKTASRVKDFRETAKRCGPFEERDDLYTPNRSYLYFSYETLEKAYERCLRKWLLQDGLKTERPVGPLFWQN